jgi:hypothetical protein
MYRYEESQAGTKVKCPKPSCPHTFTLPGRIITKPKPLLPEPTPAPLWKNVVFGLLIGLLVVGILILGTTLVYRKYSPKPSNPEPPNPTNIVTTLEPAKPDPPKESGLPNEKVLDKMVGMVVTGFKMNYPSGHKYAGVKEQPHAFLKLTTAEFAALPKAEKDKAFDSNGGKILYFKYGLNGTCFVISPDGYAITNEHVIREIKGLMDTPVLTQKMVQRMAYEKVEPKIWVILGGVQHNAQLIYVSDKYDCAILKIDGLNNAPCFKLAGSDQLKRQTKVVTLGFPASSVASWGGKATGEERGILDQKGKNAKTIKDYFLNSDFEFILKEGVVSVVKDRPGKGRLIEHDATINGGNSGGPAVLNSSGVVCGINTWGASSWVAEDGKKVEVQQGTFFSIMMSTVKSEIKQFVPNATWVE